MRSTNTKTLFVTIMLAVILILSGTVANAASFKFELDNSGKTWSLGNNNHLGSLGFKSLDTSSTFTLADIQSQISQGTAVKFYAGTSLNGVNEYTQLTPNTVFDYTGLSGPQTIQNAFYVEFVPDKVRFDNLGFKGSKTIKSDGKLGFLSSVPAPVPIPSTWLLITGGLLIATGIKKVRA